VTRFSRSICFDQGIEWAISKRGLIPDSVQIYLFYSGK
jgi:hypothetical protein